MPEQIAEVLLHGKLVGFLGITNDYARFSFVDAYIHQPNRPVLGLQFEEDIFASSRANMMLPPWFSNLLPEGRLRELIAKQNHVSPKREAQLLLAIGHDLPGAVTVRVKNDLGETSASIPKREHLFTPSGDAAGLWKFSLAGVALKFSAVREAERFTIPGTDDRGGDWIIKLPDANHAEVPQNEFAMMSLASAIGINVPEVQLVPRDMLPALPDDFWPGESHVAFAVKRFDRDCNRTAIHMEDFAQVRGIWPSAKYHSSFETVASICYRGRDREALMEFTRRLVFNVLIGNGDAHLKNWTLLYADQMKPTLSPVYDLVSTVPYINDDNIGLKWRGGRRFSDVSLESFDLLARRLGVHDLSLSDLARDVVGKTVAEWSKRCDGLIKSETLRTKITSHLEAQVGRLLS
jgi:serine/threonine-protein kinase HipA